LEPGDGQSDETIEDWYKTEVAWFSTDSPIPTTNLSQHQENIEKIPGYLRTTRYRLLYARTNAQSKKLKGLPAPDEPEPQPPTWQAIHEFSRTVEPGELDGMRNGPKAKDILGKARETEYSIYKLAKAFGNQRMFD